MKENRPVLCADQGDVRFFRVDAVPAHCVKEGREGYAIVAHSETGHHHVVESPCAQYFVDPNDPFTAYLTLAEDADVKHLRPYDTHQPVTVAKGIWGIRRQREHTPEGYRMVQD